MKKCRVLDAARNHAQICALIGESENLAGSVRPLGLQGHRAVIEDGARMIRSCEF
jgi:hypothetical protein